MAAVPPLVQLAHRGPQEAAVGVGLALPFGAKPKVTKEQKYRDAVKELGTLGMPQAACDGLLGLINQDSDEAFATDSDCFQTMACTPRNARRLLLDAFWKEEYRFNRGNVERSREDLKNLSSKLMALATAADNWWSALKTDHLANVVFDPVQRVQIRETLRDWSSIALELVKVLDATIDLASAETRLNQRRNDRTIAEQIQKSRTHALEGVKEAHDEHIADLEKEISQNKKYISDATAYVDERERVLQGLRHDIAKHEKLLSEANRTAERTATEEKAAVKTVQKKGEEEGVAKEVYLQLGSPSLDTESGEWPPPSGQAVDSADGHTNAETGSGDEWSLQRDGSHADAVSTRLVRRVSAANNSTTRAAGDPAVQKV